ncbi:EthD domain-containing protein [Achromobacter spanius]|uniref:EthD domain-containing protein n=1 Tax=Achromobacter spanius TaxID=217203 RepID=UPI0036E2F625
MKQAANVMPTSAPPAVEDPLIVVCTLLSRADNTPVSERSAAPGRGYDDVDVSERGPTDQKPSSALEANPNLNFEHWGEYWRKVHAVRFTHSDEPDDDSLSRLMRYEQLHRFAPGPTSTDAPPYRPPLDGHGKLWPTILGHVEPYRRPRWDGVAYLTFRSLDDVPAVLNTERIRSKIIPEDREIFCELAPILARQFIVVPSQTGVEPVTFVQTVKRNPDLTRQEFHHWWLNSHGNYLAKAAVPSIRRYAQLHNIGSAERGQPFSHDEIRDIDGVSLTSFGSLNDLEEYLSTDTYRAIANHESTQTVASETRGWTAVGMVIVNTPGAERRTRNA